MSCMYQNCQPTLFQSKNSPMISNVVLFFPLHFEFFGKRTRGRGLDLLRKGMAFIILNLPIKTTFHLHPFSVHLIKIESGINMHIDINMITNELYYRESKTGDLLFWLFREWCRLLPLLMCKLQVKGFQTTNFVLGWNH